jgi:hypothetical protein
VGNVEDKVWLPWQHTWAVLIRALQTQLPPDYIELEKRVDTLKKVHTTMLQVTYDTSLDVLVLGLTA